MRIRPIAAWCAMLIAPCSTTLATDQATPSFSLTAGADVVSAYYFRGIPQENQGVILQPYVSGAVSVFKNDSGWLNDITFAAASWNSIHSGPTGDGDNTDHWYESDVIGSASFRVFQDFTLTLAYTAYLSPSGAYDTYQEISLNVSYDDARLLGRWALRPHVLLACEIDNQADAGNSAFTSSDTHRGVYLELGIAPQFTLLERASGNIDVALPVTLGLSLHDYYEDASGDDDTFGFLDTGAELIVPLDLPGPGKWTLRGGPHLIWLGDTAAQIGSGVTGGNDFDVWFKLGISVSF